MVKRHVCEKLEHVWASSLVPNVTYTWCSYVCVQRHPAWAEFALARLIVCSTFKPRCDKLTNAQTNSNTTDTIFLAYNCCLQQKPLDLGGKSTKMATLMSTHGSLSCLGRVLVRILWPATLGMEQQNNDWPDFPALHKSVNYHLTHQHSTCITKFPTILPRGKSAAAVLSCAWE